MKIHYLYPGSFCPPTRGHLQIVEEAARIYPRVSIICSINHRKKKPWFTPEECKEMWQSYNLPKNTEVLTLQELREKGLKGEEMVMIRGIRRESDFQIEKKIMSENYESRRISKFLCIFSQEREKNISSTSVRKMAQKLDFFGLSQSVSPFVISKVIEKALKIDNLYIVAGKPGTGKTTILGLLSQNNPKIIHINTDKFSQKLRNIIKKEFPMEDPLKTTLKNGQKVAQILKKPWLKMIEKQLHTVSPNSTVFLEVPYGMNEDNQIFLYLGAKIIFFDCTDAKIRKRIKDRGTWQIAQFLKKFPEKKEVEKIAKKHKLRVAFFTPSSPKLAAAYKLLKVISGKA